MRLINKWKTGIVFLAFSVVVLSLPGCSAFVQGFKEGFDDGLNDSSSAASGQTEKSTLSTSLQYGTRSNPYPVGETASFDGMKTLFDTYKLELTIDEITRGSEANEIVKNANMFNDEAEPGKEYMLVKVKVKAIESEDDAKIDINSFMFEFVSKNGVKYENLISVAGLSPSLGDIYAGAETEGYIYALIDEGDEPSIVFLERDDGGIWFSTK